MSFCCDHHIGLCLSLSPTIDLHMYLYIYLYLYAYLSNNYLRISLYAYINLLPVVILSLGAGLESLTKLRELYLACNAIPNLDGLPVQSPLQTIGKQTNIVEPILPPTLHFCQFLCLYSDVMYLLYWVFNCFDRFVDKLPSFGGRN